MIPETIEITKTSKGLLSTLGIGKKKQNVVLKLTDKGLYYNSTLGDIGLIQSDNIKTVEIGKVQSREVIKIELSENYDLKSKLNKFRQKLSELYKKETGAEILIFPQDTDFDLKELNDLIKKKLKK
ncbi:MAG TPA: hypothetical protein DIU39_05675 [Flavobacteriales bacterium]|nr:hypothetical protein [Flavobacteriales bacterium]|tara:strand:+ start:183038 stop:183415 length:378 start_codon:yes stop_codon:yes gene_type:complete